MSWPADYADRLSGAACQLCDEGRPEETHGRIRFWKTKHIDAYLQRRGVQRGYAVVIWRGAHAVEVTDLSEAEATTFWLETLQAGRAMQSYYAPLKMNYQLLGNGQPHLHFLLAPRFLDDVAAGKPLPAERYQIFPEADLRRDLAALRKLLNYGT